MAELIGVSRKSIEDVVDERSLPTPTLLKKVAKHFGVQESFFTAEGSERTSDSETSSKGLSHEARKSNPATKKQESLTLKTLASRYQSLVELMVEKGVFSAAEYNQKIQGK